MTTAKRTLTLWIILSTSFRNLVLGFHHPVGHFGAFCCLPQSIPCLFRRRLSKYNNVTCNSQVASRSAFSVTLSFQPTVASCARSEAQSSLPAQPLSRQSPILHPTQHSKLSFDHAHQLDTLPLSKCPNTASTLALVTINVVQLLLTRQEPSLWATLVTWHPSPSASLLNDICITAFDHLSHSFIYLTTIPCLPISPAVMPPAGGVRISPALPLSRFQLTASATFMLTVKTRTSLTKTGGSMHNPLQLRPNLISIRLCKRSPSPSRLPAPNLLVHTLPLALLLLLPQLTKPKPYHPYSPLA